MFTQCYYIVWDAGELARMWICFGFFTVSKLIDDKQAVCIVYLYVIDTQSNKNTEV